MVELPTQLSKPLS